MLLLKRISIPMSLGCVANKEEICIIPWAVFNDIS